MTVEQRIRELERQVSELRSRLPKHSVPAAMMLELEDLEDELERLRQSSQGDSSTPQQQNQPG